MSRHLSFTVNDKVSDLLDKMEASGLWGDSEREMLEGLMMFAVREAVGRGLVRPPEAKFDDVEEAPQPRTYTCQTCKDGDNTEAVDNDWKCPACGEIRMPF